MSKQTHSNTELNVNQFFFTIINEIGDSSMLLMSASEQPLKMSSQFSPVISFESKEIYLRQLKYSDKSIDHLLLEVPFEVFYFNQNLNFYEPFIEKTQLNMSIGKDAKNKT